MKHTVRIIIDSPSYISREEKSAPGFETAKDRITLLLGGNASGTLKLQPLLVYHSETPRVMRGIPKCRWPVIWISNRKVWAMQQIFSKWYSKHFYHKEGKVHPCTGAEALYRPYGP